MGCPYASYRRLRDSSTSALVAAVEVYNKPAMLYREESFVILLVNAWELLLKAILRKNRKNIFYRKRRNEPYRSFSIGDAAQKCMEAHVFPGGFASRAALSNLELLVAYRDNAVHFYNHKGFRVLIYGLAQTSVKNFVDLTSDVFGDKVLEAMPQSLLPVGLESPVDPLAFIRQAGSEQAHSPVSEYIHRISETVQELEEEGVDTDRLLTFYTVKLESVKKVESADFVVGVDGTAQGTETLLLERFRDPNNFPYREREIIGMKLTVDGVSLGQFQLRAISRRYDVRRQRNYCWADEHGALTKYTSEYVRFLKGLSKEEIGQAVSDYSSHLRGLRAGRS